MDWPTGKSSVGLSETGGADPGEGRLTGTIDMARPRDELVPVELLKLPVGQPANKPPRPFGTMIICQSARCLPTGRLTHLMGQTRKDVRPGSHQVGGRG